MLRTAQGPDGREWIVRSYRFRRPPWRLVDPGLGILYVVLAPVTLVVLPALIFGVEVWARLLWALVTPQRWIEATHAGPPRSRLSWLTDTEHEEAVIDQVARQLALGYERVQPHRATFLGFG